MDGIWNDVRHAARTLSRSPGFTVLVVTTLTIGIGAATTVFALLNAVLLKPLPYPDPEHLVALVNTRNAAITASSHYVSAPRIRAWKDSSTAISDVAVYLLGASVNLTEVSRPQQIVAARVSASFFDTFGARATRGRTFTSFEDEPGAADVVILSDAFWRAQFGSDPTIIGRTITLNPRPTVVIGVLDGAFDSRSLSPTLVDVPDIWIPLRLDPATRDDANMLIAVARIRPHATLEEARVQAEVASNAFRRDFPGEQPVENSFSVVLLRTIVEGDTRASLLLLFSAVGLVALANRLGEYQQSSPRPSIGSSSGICDSHGRRCESRPDRAAVAHRVRPSGSRRSHRRPVSCVGDGIVPLRTTTGSHYTPRAVIVTHRSSRRPIHRCNGHHDRTRVWNRAGAVRVANGR